MKKYLLVFLLLLCFTFLNVKVKATDGESPEFTEIEREKNKNCVEKHKILVKSIAKGKTKYNSFIFPESFSGAYINSNQEYVIGYKSGYSPEDYAVIMSAAINPNTSNDPKVIFVEQQFSYNELNIIHEIMTDNLIQSSAFGVAVDEKENKVKIYIDHNGDRAKIITLLKNNLSDFNPNKIMFVIDEKPDYKNITYITPYSGTEIFYRSGFLNLNINKGSIGFHAKDLVTGKYGIVTAGHVAPEGKNLYDSNSNLLGIASKRISRGAIDASFVPFINTTMINWISTSYMKYSTTYGSNYIRYNRIASEEDIVKGAKVSKIGQSSGYNTGFIENTNFSCTVEGTLYTNVIYMTNKNKYGDSGGPIYIEDLSGNLIIAINFAGPYDGSATIGCRASNIVALLNLEIYAPTAL